MGNLAGDDAPNDDVDERFNDLPVNLYALVDAVGFAEFDLPDKDEQAVYGRAKEGRCMTCGNKLGKEANFIVTRSGIVGGYCGGVCHTDMAVMGFLQEQHADLLERIQFREGGGTGGDADKPEGDT